MLPLKEEQELFLLKNSIFCFFCKFNNHNWNHYRLENPTFYLKFNDIKVMIMRDLELNFNVQDQNSQIFKLIENPEFIL